ncbi:hypothetical protein TNCT_435841 [Trichonephila clavata]|uniref:Uncharacterized protein n=1 Tax=Trichonephila clavata TaxID=2740835 RepID=A0A8X6KPI2_TRICU|nr:hypothetical protein TNCT_435841 [Trichonephila clavata]
MTNLYKNNAQVLFYSESTQANLCKAFLATKPVIIIQPGLSPIILRAKSYIKRREHLCDSIWHLTPSPPRDLELVLPPFRKKKSRAFKSGDMYNYSFFLSLPPSHTQDDLKPFLPNSGLTSVEPSGLATKEIPCDRVVCTSFFKPWFKEFPVAKGE